jgi:hypothetical protein
VARTIAPLNASYTFTVSSALDELQADVCFDGAAPERLGIPMDGTREYLESATLDGKALTVDDKGVQLSGVPDAACVRYVIAIDQLLSRAEPWDGVARMGDDLLLSPDWWLWPPEPRGERTVRARFRGDLQPAVPWPQQAHAGYSHVIPESTFVWKAQAAFGRFERRELKAGGSSLDVVVMADGFGARRAAVMSWLQTSADAVAALLGRFPVKRALVLMVGEKQRRGSFGFTVRGGGATATLLLPSDSSDKALASDWTAVHELLHFALPPLPTADAWLYEGFVTYLTAVARARAGITSEEYGWWELFDGFSRGRKVGTGVTLREESKAMHQSRAYWRVYWAGAAMALSMDMQLRKRGRSLEETVSALAKTYPDESRDWKGEQVIARLDGHCGGDEPSRVAKQHVNATNFPDTDSLAKALGVRLAPKGKSVIYDDSAPNAAIRRAIMKRR